MHGLFKLKVQPILYPYPSLILRPATLVIPRRKKERKKAKQPAHHIASNPPHVPASGPRPPAVGCSKTTTAFCRTDILSSQVPHPIYERFVITHCCSQEYNSALISSTTNV